MTVDRYGSKQWGVTTSGSILWHSVPIIYISILLKDSEGNAQVPTKQMELCARWFVPFGNLFF